MYFKSLDYPVIVIDNDYESPRIGGILIRALVEELRSNDQRVLCGLNLDDARAGARTPRGARPRTRRWLTKPIWTPSPANWGEHRAVSWRSPTAAPTANPPW